MKTDLKIKNEVDTAIEKFYAENGTNPKVIVMNRRAFAKLSYDIARSEGKSEEDCLLCELPVHKGITVAVTDKRSHPDFQLI